MTTTTKTVSDPVEPEILNKFNELEDTEVRLSLELLSLEKRKLQLLKLSLNLEKARQQVFEGILIERGLPLDTQIRLDPETGGIELLDTPPATVPLPPTEV